MKESETQSCSLQKQLAEITNQKVALSSELQRLQDECIQLEKENAKLTSKACLMSIDDCYKFDVCIITVSFYFRSDEA